MNVTITDGALKEIRSIAERKKIKDVAVYLDIVTTCCSMIPFVKVIEQQDAGSEAIKNVAGMPIYSCDLIKQILMNQDDVKAEIDLFKFFDFDELMIRFYKDAFNLSVT